jgi:hypothetical protein
LSISATLLLGSSRNTFIIRRTPARDSRFSEAWSYRRLAADW